MDEEAMHRLRLREFVYQREDDRPNDPALSSILQAAVEDSFRMHSRKARMKRL